MSFSIQLYNCESEPNALNKTLTAIGDAMTGVFRESTSVVSPSVLIEGSSVKANYMYIGSPINRYYFIDDIITERNNLLRIKGHVDVLQTYKSDILDIKGVVKRNAKNVNKYLTDDKILQSAKREIITTKFSQSMDAEQIILVVSNV